MLNQYDIEYIIKCLKDGKRIPEEYKYDLFPTIQKEYELTYAGKMRKEDILSDTDEISMFLCKLKRLSMAMNIQLHRKIGRIY